jgi:PPOX class probable F420-dependent enzyme
MGKQLPSVAGGRRLELLGIRFGHGHKPFQPRRQKKGGRARFSGGRSRVSTGMTTSHLHQPASSAPTYADPLARGLPADHALQVARQILAGPHLSVLATTNADGSAQMSVIFVKPDGDDILFSTIEGRRKTKNMLRDPRATLLLHSLPVGGRSAYATIHGTVQLTDDPDGAFHQVMYGLHMGGATPPPEPGAHRLIGRVRPQHAYAPFPYSSE